MWLDVVDFKVGIGYSSIELSLRNVGGTGVVSAVSVKAQQVSPPLLLKVYNDDCGAHDCTDCSSRAYHCDCVCLNHQVWDLIGQSSYLGRIQRHTPTCSHLSKVWPSRTKQLIVRVICMPGTAPHEDL